MMMNYIFSNKKKYVIMVMVVTIVQSILSVKMMFKCSNNINAIYNDYKNGRVKIVFFLYLRLNNVITCIIGQKL